MSQLGVGLKSFPEEVTKNSDFKDSAERFIRRERKLLAKEAKGGK
jgi:hypothetical protein